MSSGTPPTPSDEPRTRSDDPDAPPGPKAPRSGRSSVGPPDSPTSDEISVLLSTSMEKPEPDPMLGGSSSWDLEKAAAAQAPAKSRRSRSTDGLGIEVESPSLLESPPPAAGQHRGPDAPYAWSSVLLKSYASAASLALIWLVWSGKAAPKPAAPAREAPAPRRRPSEPAVLPPATPSSSVESASGRMTTLGKSIVVDDLEISPLLVLRKSVRTARDLGEENLVRDHGGCLVLTLRLKNLHADEPLRPLDAEDLRDGEAFAIDAPPGPRIGMFALAPRSEWAIVDQVFPTIAPGEVEDVTLVSEPISGGRLASSMIWRFRIRTSPSGDETAEVGVRFGRDDVHGDGD